MVVGRVGSGKSSLVNALLGEMEPDSGQVFRNKNVGYAAQQAWIINATVRDNILMGKKFDQNLWDQVVDVCSLGDDLAILPGGDLTEIGEKGVNLSGG